MTQSKARLVRPINQPPVTADAYLTGQQFCQRYRLSRRTAQRWRVTGDGPPFVRLGPHKVVYRLSDVEKWAAARTFAHRADELSRTTF
jgi:predicted DNA-binding transcriptional regulator AlpA